MGIPQTEEKTLTALRPVAAELWFRHVISITVKNKDQVESARTKTKSSRVIFGEDWQEFIPFRTEQSGLLVPRSLSLKKKQEDNEHWRCLVDFARSAPSNTNTKEKDKQEVDFIVMRRNFLLEYDPELRDTLETLHLPKSQRGPNPKIPSTIARSKTPKNPKQK